MGQYVVKRLEKLQKNDVIVFSRNRKGKGSFVLGNITDIDALEKAFPADIVIHLAASFGDSDPDIYSTNVTGTRNVAELCKKYKTKQLIFMSSTAAIGETKFAEESSERKPKTRYERSKRDAEDVVTNSGLNYTIIRAPVILGPSSMWLDVARAAKKKFPLIGRGDNRFHLAYVEDVAELICKSAGNKKAFGQTFHAATRDAPTYKEFYKMLCDALGTEMTKKSVPVFAVKTFSALHETSSWLKGKNPKPIFSRSSINRLTRDRVVSIKKAKKLLGFTPKHNTKKAIEATIKYFKKANMI